MTDFQLFKEFPRFTWPEVSLKFTTDEKLRAEVTEQARVIRD